MGEGQGAEPGTDAFTNIWKPGRESGTLPGGPVVAKLPLAGVAAVPGATVPPQAEHLEEKRLV